MSFHVSLRLVILVQPCWLETEILLLPKKDNTTIFTFVSSSNQSPAKELHGARRGSIA